MNCEESVPEARSLDDDLATSDALLAPAEDGALMASYSVFVLEPGQRVQVSPVCSDDQCDATRDWLFWLCIAFGFGFFLMLIVVVFLLSAVTCSCVSQVSIATIIKHANYFRY